MNNKWGYINQVGNEIIPSVYEDAYSFVNEKACVQLNSKWGCIDRAGKEVLPFVYNTYKDIQNIIYMTRINRSRVLVLKTFRWLDF